MISRKFALFYGLLRIFGFFPYTWKDTRLNCNPKNTAFRSCILNKSLFWNIWSGIFTLFVICVNVFDCVNTILVPRGLEGFFTLYIVHISFDVLISVTVISLQVLFWLQSDRLPDFINYFSKQNITIPKARSLTIFAVSMIFFVAPCNCLVLFGSFAQQMDTLPMVTYMIKTFLSIYYILFVAIVYQKNILFINVQIIEALEPCMKLYHKFKLQCSEETTESNFDFQSSSLYEPPILYQNRDEPDLNSSASLSKKSAYSRTFQPETNMDSSSSFSKRVSPGNISSSDLTESLNVTSSSEKVYLVFSKIQNEILTSYEYQRIVNSYIDKPMAISMFCLLIWLVLSIFYFTMWNIVSPLQRVLCFLNLLTCTVPIIYLPNSNNCLCEKLTDIKWALTFLSHHNGTKHLKEQLLCLRQLLDEHPGFNIYGIFNLQRARIVDIFSFVATYIVILLQFNLNERHPEAE